VGTLVVRREHWIHSVLWASIIVLCEMLLNLVQ